MKPAVPAFAIVVGFCIAAVASANPDVATFDARVKPFLQQYCISCHSGADPDGHLDLVGFGPVRAIKDADTWHEVLTKINTEVMPPPDADPRPSPQEVYRVTEWISAELRRAERVFQGSGGKVVLRRLNRSEFQNTVRDLVGVEFNPAKLPPDDVAFGFDNVGNALTMSPFMIERYLDASEEILDKALFFGARPKIRKYHWEAEDDPTATKTRLTDDERLSGEFAAPRTLYRSGSNFPRMFLNKGTYLIGKQAPIDVLGLPVPTAGKFVLRVMAGAYSWTSEDEAALERSSYDAATPPQRAAIDAKKKEKAIKKTYPPKPPLVPPGLEAEQGLLLQVWVGDEVRAEIPMRYDEGLQLREAQMHLPRGGHVISLKVIVPDFYGVNKDRKVAIPGGYVVDWVAVEGPLYDAWPPETHTRIFGEPKPQYTWDDAREILRRFAERAFRRPVEPQEVEVFVETARSESRRGATIEQAIRFGLQAVLCSPNFVYLGEPSLNVAQRRPLNDFELASRLSYFLWSSMPDDELLAAAKQGRLRDPSTLEEQIRRMIRDPKIRSFAVNFVGQWLELRSLGDMPPTHKLYPAYDPSLEHAMLDETRMFFEHVLREDLPIRSFIDSDFTFLNERLAFHYGIPNVRGREMRLVRLTPENKRGGVLTQGSILTLTSDGVRTSPVKRGKFLLERILADPPPPPPGAVPPLPEIAGQPKTLKERLEAHRSRPGCIGCHTKIDHLGFALENFDAIGAWRDKEVTADKNVLLDVDASGTTPAGQTFQNFAELKRILLAEDERFYRCLVEHMMIYALGRGLDYTDQDTLNETVARLKADGGKMQSLIRLIVDSEQFQTK